MERPGPDPITYNHIGNAIGQFERGLVTPARWDRYLEGDKGALTEQEKEGFKIFSNIGCLVCHMGELRGASMFGKVGVVLPWPNQKDSGRERVTQAVAAAQPLAPAPAAREPRSSAGAGRG